MYLIPSISSILGPTQYILAQLYTNYRASQG